MSLAGSPTQIADHSEASTESTAHRASQQDLKDWIRHVVRDPERACHAVAGHDGPRIERAPRRFARISNPTSTIAWMMISVVTTAAIVPEPPEAALVPEAVS